MKYRVDSNKKLYLFITILLMLIPFFSPLSAIERANVYGIPEKYKIEVITAESSNNAIKIAEKLNNIFNKPVYISYTDSKYKILIGGIKTKEEALSIKKRLNELGIITPIIIETAPLSIEDDVTAPFSTDKELDLYATHINSNIKIDGILDESAWEKSTAYDGYFFQQQPFDRTLSSDKTSVKILVDKSNLYFGISCSCAEPHKIVAKAMRRDAMLWSDDNVELFLDTYHDGRNSYYFSTNPLGAKVDAIITDEGNYINRQWDTVWYCDTSRDDKGWYAEIKIPFKSLNFKEGEGNEWGINIGRHTSHKNEYSFIVPIPRALSYGGKYKASLYGNLKNIRNPKSGKNIQVIPYTSGGGLFEYRPNANESRFNQGLDFRYNITPNFTAEFTYKTDFAQVEADQEIINYSRFNINWPEKREFFLQSAGLFNFGATGSSRGGGGTRRRENFTFFYSRSIGIYDGKETPIFGGAKLSGKLDKYSIGFLNIQTEETTIYDEDEDEYHTEPSTNYTVFKIKRDVLRNSNISGMFLNKQNSEGYYDRAVGIDSYFSHNNVYYFSGAIANNIKEEDTKDNWVGMFRAGLRKDWINASISHTRLDSLFNPDMSFIRRENIRSSSGRVEFTKWLNNRYFRRISLRSSISYTTDNHNILQTRRNGYDLNIAFKSGDYFSLGFDKEYDFLAEEDEIREIKIDPGKYNITDHSVSFRTFSGRPAWLRVSYRWGGEYDGNRQIFSLQNSINLSNNIYFYVGYTYTNIDLKYGELKSNLLSGRLSYSFSPRLYAKYFIQWNDADQKIVGNLLVDYIFRPKSHIYLVYNENRDTTIYGINNIKNRAILAKLTYLFTL